MASKNTFLQQFSISSLIALTGIWVPFIHLYLINTGNLTLPLSVHVPQLGILTAVVVGIALSIQMLAPSRFRTGVSCFLLFVGIFLWAESTLFIGHFGIFQGGDLDWDRNRTLFFLELVLVAAFVAAALRFKGRLLHHAFVISVLLTLSSTANLYRPFRENLSRHGTGLEYTFTQDGVFRVSPEKNVLIFVLDTFQSDVFAEIIVAHSELKKMLDGFTYFPNATSAFPKTYTSIPDLLTGQAFENSQPFSQYKRKAYLGDSLPRVLKRRGFDVRYRSFAWQPYFAHPEVADNLAALSSADDRRWMQNHEFIQLCNLSLFRISPFLAKPWVYNDNQFRIREAALPRPVAKPQYVLGSRQRTYSKGNPAEDLALLDQMVAFLSATEEKPSFRVFHFRGTHVPLNLNRNLTYIGKQPRTRDAFKGQAEAMLKMLSIVLGKLKDLSVYDNSMIFVVADHGAGEFGKVGIREDDIRTLGLDAPFSAPDEPVPTTIVQGGIPLMLAKRIAETGPMAVSFAPVALGDVINTVFRELGFQDLARGPSIYEIPEGSPRTRLHRHYQFTKMELEYIVPMTEYRITGFSWDPASWSLTGRNLNRQAAESIDGALVVLGQNGNLDTFDHEGWSKPQSQGRFIVGGSASVVIPVVEDSRTRSLEIGMDPRYIPANPVPMEVRVNDVSLGMFTASRGNPASLWAIIPDQSINQESKLSISLDLESDRNASPLIIEIQVNHDHQRLSYALGDTLSFVGGGNATGCLGHGWSVRENWGTWTLGYGANLYFALESVPIGDLEVEARIRPAIFGHSPPLLVDVMANGTTVSKWSFAEGDAQEKTFQVPCSLVRDSRALDLMFRIRNPRSPQDFSPRTDARQLGVGLFSLVIRDANPVEK